LLNYNQQIFRADEFGERAGSLIDLGWIEPGFRKGQFYELDNMHWRVKPLVWDILKKHRNYFEYKPGFTDSGLEIEPWRVHRERI